MEVRSWMFTVPAGLLAVIGAVADRGEKLIQVGTLFAAWTARLPLGAWSFLLSLLLAMLVWATAIAKLPPAACGRRAHLSAEFLALLAALFVTLGQQSAGPHSSGAFLQATISGLIAGLAAPFLSKTIASLIPRKP